MPLNGILTLRRQISQASLLRVCTELTLYRAMCRFPHHVFVVGGGGLFAFNMLVLFVRRDIYNITRVWRWKVSPLSV